MTSQKGLIGWLILGSLALLIIFGGLLVLNSYSSLPGDPSYPIKQITEDLKLSANELSFAGRANVYLEMSEERLNELSELIKRRGGEKEIIETLSKLQDQQTKALNNLERALGKSSDVTELLNKFEAILQKEQEVFPELSYQVLGSAQEALQKASSYVSETLSRVEYLKSAR